MNIQILYDNNAGNDFKVGWGFSCFVKSSRNNVLFDTGWDGNILIHNMKTAGINPEEIDKIFISHSDWDHIGGLNHILKYRNEPEIYVPESLSINLKNELKRYGDVVEIFKAGKICENIWTTGELGEKIKEQAMLVKTEKGNVILTGCAHPGLENIIEKAGEFGKIYAVIGGFHDSDVDILKGIPVVMPCHCTEKIEEIKKVMPESYKRCEAGLNLFIGD